jgi:Family of unknown function (DUF6527)
VERQWRQFEISTATYGRCYAKRAGYLALCWLTIMNLSELDPRWLSPNLFVFRCPHCREVWLVCKNIPMKMSAQVDLLTDAIGPDWIPAKQDFSWNIVGPGPIQNGYQIGIDFARVTVTPSIDASASGHWHGFITNGEIR